MAGCCGSAGWALGSEPGWALGSAASGCAFSCPGVCCSEPGLCWSWDEVPLSAPPPTAEGLVFVTWLPSAVTGHLFHKPHGKLLPMANSKLVTTPILIRKAITAGTIAPTNMVRFRSGERRRNQSKEALIRPMKLFRRSGRSGISRGPSACWLRLLPAFWRTLPGTLRTRPVTLSR